LRKTRDALACRRSGLEEICPEALDLEAEALTGLRLSLHGHASDLAGEHSDAVWRRALRGEYPLDGADLCRLARQAPDAFREWVRPILADIGNTLGTTEGHPTRGLTEEAAEVAVEATALVHEAARDEADGTLDEDERDRTMRRAEAVARELADVIARLARPEISKPRALHAEEKEASCRG
jgi:hypothetical protein